MYMLILSISTRRVAHLVTFLCQVDLIVCYTINRIDHMDIKDQQTRDALFAQIRAEMAYRGISQKELAEKIEMDPAVLSRYMRARRKMDLDVYFRISRALDLQPNYLMSKAVEKTNE